MAYLKIMYVFRFIVEIVEKKTCLEFSNVTYQSRGLLFLNYIKLVLPVLIYIVYKKAW